MGFKQTPFNLHNNVQGTVYEFLKTGIALPCNKSLDINVNGK